MAKNSTATRAPQRIPTSPIPLQIHFPQTQKPTDVLQIVGPESFYQQKTAIQSSSTTYSSTPSRLLLVTLTSNMSIKVVQQWFEWSNRQRRPRVSRVAAHPLDHYSLLEPCGPSVGPPIGNRDQRYPAPNQGLRAHGAESAMTIDPGGPNCGAGIILPWIVMNTTPFRTTWKHAEQFVLESEREKTGQLAPPPQRRAGPLSIRTNHQGRVRSVPCNNSCYVPLPLQQQLPQKYKYFVCFARWRRITLRRRLPNGFPHRLHPYTTTFPRHKNQQTFFKLWDRNHFLNKRSQQSSTACAYSSTSSRLLVVTLASNMPIKVVQPCFEWSNGAPASPVFF